MQGIIPDVISYSAFPLLQELRLLQERWLQYEVLCRTSHLQRNYRRL